MSPTRIIFLLSLLLGIQPVATDLYLPALPAIKAEFGAETLLQTIAKYKATQCKTKLNVNSTPLNRTGTAHLTILMVTNTSNNLLCFARPSPTC